MMSGQKKLLVIGAVWPEPNSSAAGSHMLQILKCFTEEHWQITYAATAAPSGFQFDLSTLGIEAVPVKINDSTFDAFIKEVQPDVVLFDRFMVEEQFGWRVAEICPEAIRIIETVDLHFLRKARKKLANPTMADFRNRDTAREMSAMYRSDLNLIISFEEVRLLEEKFGFPASLMHNLPFLVPSVSDDYHTQFPSFHQRSGFVTIGNFLHEPNYISVKWLKETIWLLIRKLLPDASIYIYGAYMQDHISSWHRPSEGFYLMGRAEEALAVVQKSRVFLAPLTFGAGQKGKLLDAMLTGTPSVTTTIGAESMHPHLDWNGAIADNAEAFAEAAVKLYSDEAQWLQASAQSTVLLQKVFNRELYANEFMKKIYQLMENRVSHREGNFTGFLLMQDFNYATKYMSRWIELKNQIISSSDND